MYKVKSDTCPICGAVYKIKYSDLYNQPFIVLEISDYCKHSEEIKARYINTKIVKKNKGLT